VLVATNLSGEGQITVGYSIKYYEQIPVELCRLQCIRENNCHYDVGENLLTVNNDMNDCKVISAEHCDLSLHYITFHSFLGQLFRVSLIKPVSNVCPCVRTSIRPSVHLSVTNSFFDFSEIWRVHRG